MRNVLVIDDERMIRDMLKQALSIVDVEVETADDAECGMAKFDNGTYDLVITDVRMPGIDGRRIVHHIRGSKRHRTPVIGLSGTPWLLDDGGFDDTLQKPFAIKSLIDKVQYLTANANDN